MRPLVRPAALLLLAAAVSGGCDQLPWGRHDASQPTPLNASTPSVTAVPVPSVLPSEIVAKVNGTPISRRDVEFAIQEARAGLEAAGGVWEPLALQDDPDRYDLPDVLNDLTVVELRAKDALARGLDRQPEAQRRLYYLYRSFFAQEWVRWQLERLNPTAEEIAQFYNDNKPGFRDPDRIKVRQLIVDAEDKAKAALVKLLEGMDFVEIAKQVSLQPDAAQGPLADKWVLRSVEKAAFAPEDDTLREFVDPALEQAAFSIEKDGGISHYVKAGDGRYYIFQLVKRQPGRQQELLEVSDGIRTHLQLKALSDLTDALRAKAAIEPFSDRLEGVSQ